MHKNGAQGLLMMFMWPRTCVSHLEELPKAIGPKFSGELPELIQLLCKGRKGVVRGCHVYIKPRAMGIGTVGPWE